ncbi:uncharacterized protein BYT42DRAFT_559868 [Radiomyces spectabilis]|uniref:uncharacterized protein n=1 Tax=Radiomyces spectabilis TaxID=64574 RepID=UPI00221F1DED|nr:uncharacterized protein BYT42DRAFT_559868 [Radiomyces spectabilis]KAI8388370.1 hypothetical protein BYT42DRAFT_559868 [Radiomyces spectabilis]
MKSFHVLLMALMALVSSAHAYYYQASLDNLPFMDGMAFAQRNNSLLLFGGEGRMGLTNNFYELTQTPKGFTWRSLPQNNTPPPNVYSQAVVSNSGNSFILFMGSTATSQSNPNSTIATYFYDFQSQQWAANPSNNNPNATGLPIARKQFTATVDKNDNIYVFGGQTMASSNGSPGTPLGDLWVFDKNLNAKQLANAPLPLYGHTTTYLSSGKLVVIGGSLPLSPVERDLVNINIVQIYDIASNTWTSQTTKVMGNVVVGGRMGHNAVAMGNKIVIFGGTNDAIIPKRQYTNRLAILDTDTWTWTVPAVDGILPSKRAYAAAASLDGQHVTVGFGVALNAFYNDLNVFRVSDNSWIRGFVEDDNKSSGVSPGLIAGVTVAGVILLVIILFLLWRFKSFISFVVVRIHRDIWKPRTGEPLWAETARIIFQVLFLFLFACFLAFVIRQAVQSPNVTQRIQEAASTVHLPNIRFCFDGWPAIAATSLAEAMRNPAIACSTNTGSTCSNFITPLNMSMFTPSFSDNLGAVSCFHFQAPSNFTMADTSGRNDGSNLIFTLLGDQNITNGRIHVSVYPKQMDPNILAYNLPSDEPVLMSDVALGNWKNRERNDMQVGNVYDIEPFTYSVMSYQLIDHKYLQDKGWNYVGFLPIYNNTPEVESMFRMEAPNPNYISTHGFGDLGIFSVFPEGFIEVTDREVKLYTLLNALGFVGGVFGLLIAVQAWLFGFRPRSPWGVVHRWSVGDMKRSLLRGLSSKFKTTDSGIPLVHPVHSRFSVSDFNNLGMESEAQRVARVEERMQVLELLFKAYYVDDEVFRSLDNANKVASPDSPLRNRNPLFPSTEKVTEDYPRGKDNDGFAHMFQQRPASLASMSSDSTSQRHLNANGGQADKYPLRDL